MNTRNLLAMKTNIGAIVLAVLGILSACGVSIPTQWADIAVKASASVLALGLTIAGRVQSGARAPEVATIFGFAIQTMDSLNAMLAAPAEPSPAPAPAASGFTSLPDVAGAIQPSASEHPEAATPAQAAV